MLTKDKKIDSLLFEEVFKKGRKKFFKDFYIIYLKDKQNKKCKIACVTPKKQFKKAVQRNSAKRLCFNLINEIYSQLPSSLNIIVFLKKEVMEIEKEDFKKELEKLLEL